MKSYHNKKYITRKTFIFRIFLFFLLVSSLALTSYTAFLLNREFKSRAGSKENGSITDLRSVIIAAFEENGLEPRHYKLSETKKDKQNKIHIINIIIPEDISITLFHLYLNDIIARNGGRIAGGTENAESRNAVIEADFGDEKGIKIVLKKKAGLKSFMPRIAVIVDDLGIKDLSLAEKLCGIGQKLTLSILPFQEYSTEVMDIAKKSGIPFILHMPMEPIAKESNPGEGAILASDDEISVRRKLERAFRSIKESGGINNHMGSRATENARTMEYVAKYLRENGIFFVDSRTTRNSTIWETSLKFGVKSVQMTGYLDVIDEKQAIESRFEELAEEAILNGWAVVICHDRPNTVDVLERKMPELASRGIKFVAIDELVR